MKTLNTIQTLSKVGKVLCRIIFVFCLVGFIGSIVGIICLACIPEGIRIGGVTIKGLIEQSAEISMGTCYASMAVAIVLCAGEAVLCKLAEHYFTKELEAGNPFTFDGAKELIRLGIWTICIPIITAVIAAVVYAVMEHVFTDVSAMDIGGSVSVGLGVMFIISGLLCRYGAGLREGNNE